MAKKKVSNKRNYLEELKEFCVWMKDEEGLQISPDVMHSFVERATQEKIEALILGFLKEYSVNDLTHIELKLREALKRTPPDSQ